MDEPKTRAARGAGWALTVLTTLNFLNYVDRYVLPAVLVDLRKEGPFRAATDAQLGDLQFWFLVVYMICAPLAGPLSDRVPRKYIVAAGVAIWSLATVWSGMAQSYNELLAARALIGFGEAGYATVAPAIIADLFSKDRRARMLSIFYTATPAGSALGIVIGGMVAQHYGWRNAFWVVGLPGFFFALLALFMVEPRRGAQDAASDEAAIPWRQALNMLRRNGKWWNVTLGGALFTFSLGALAFWTPTYFVTVRHMSVGDAAMIFGGITVLAGLIGTYVGGHIGDAWARRDGGGYLRLSGLSLIASVPFAFAAPYVPSLAGSLAVFFIAEVLVFLNTGPLNAALLASVPPRLRETAVGMNILLIHLLGDAASPRLVGSFCDALQRRGTSEAAARTLSIAATSLPLLVGGLILARGARLFRRDPC